jgi:hypothetical protein
MTMTQCAVSAGGVWAVSATLPDWLRLLMGLGVPVLCMALYHWKTRVDASAAVRVGQAGKQAVDALGKLRERRLR